MANSASASAAAPAVENVQSVIIATCQQTRFHVPETAQTSEVGSPTRGHICIHKDVLIGDED